MYIKPIAINTHIDCANTSKCSVRYILKATARSLESVLLKHFLLRRRIWHRGGSSSMNSRVSKMNVLGDTELSFLIELCKCRVT